MFGSYPFPPNIYEDNTIEFINVYVKDGPPPQIPKVAKEPSRLTQQEWLNLSMQIWPMYPEDVKRTGGHPAPFPTVLPQRLILSTPSPPIPGLGSKATSSLTCSMDRVPRPWLLEQPAGAGLESTSIRTSVPMQRRASR